MGILLPLTIFAQDKIYKPDGSQIEVKVLEITPNEIKYKKYSNLDGPVYTIYKSDVLLIVYENGESEVFTTKSSEIEKFEEKESEYGKRIFSFNPVTLPFSYLSISYEVIKESGKTGLKIPIYIGYRGGYFASGLDMKIYPTGQGKVKYFIGPSTQLGLLYEYTIYGNEFFDSNSLYKFRTSDFVFASLMLNHGVSINLDYSTNIALGMKVGMVFLSEFAGGTYFVFPWGLVLDISFGWRF